MAGEIQAPYQSGKICYFLIRDKNARIWNVDVFETFTTSNYETYGVEASEQGTSGYYTGTFPASAAPGQYNIEMKEQLGIAVDISDPTVSTGEVNWNGSAPIGISDLATSGQLSNALPIRISRGNMITNFPLYLKSAADHVTPFTSGVVSGRVSRDGAIPVPLQSGLVTEVGNGFYKTTLTSGDLNATTVALLFTARSLSGGNADPLPFSFVMQKSLSG
jgi:hypothetical protein